MLAIGSVLCALATRVDVPCATWVRDHPFSFAAKQVLEVARWPGSYLFTLVVAGLVATRARDSSIGRARAVLLLVTTIASSLTAIAIKWGIGRTRPFRGAEAFDLMPLQGGAFGIFYQRNLSFPSGDATLAFATAATLAQLFPRLRAPAFAWAGVVAIARVLQGAHYPSDVLGGAVLGLAMSWLILSLSPRRRCGHASTSARRARTLRDVA